MTNLKRWVDDGAPDGIRELLVAASEEQPKAIGAQRTLVALGVGGAVVTGAAHAAGVAGATAGVAAAAKGATSASTLAIVMKWGLIGAVGAMTTLGAVHVVLQSPAHETSPAPPAAPQAATPPRVNAAAARAPEPVATEATEAVPDEAEDEVTRAPSVAAVPPSVAPKVAGASASTQTPPVPSREDSQRMLEEVSGIDRARSALARGDARGTLAAIDAYESKFSERRFEPEALYLRMEAFGRLGDRAGERAAAQRLLAAFPNAPQSARAKIVLSGAR